MAAVNVYHFTDTARLPWIIESGELRPSKNRIGGLPLDFLWATTDERGCRSAAQDPTLYRQGGIPIVLFTLQAADFAPWRETALTVPSWTADHMSMLEASAKKLGDDPGRWNVRVEPLSLASVIAVSAKAYIGGWRPIEATDEFCIRFPDANRRGFVIGDQAYCATQEVQGDRVSYSELSRQGVQRRENATVVDR
jgi:hypothetical protein